MIKQTHSRSHLTRSSAGLRFWLALAACSSLALPTAANLFRIDCAGVECSSAVAILSGVDASAVADLDRDGSLDAAAARWAPAPTLERWVLEPEPCLQQIIPVSLPITDLLLVDLDGDDDLDVIAASSGLAEVFLLDASGELARVEQVVPSIGTNLIVGGDFDGDGRFDLVLIGATIEVARGSATPGRWFDPPQQPVGLEAVASDWHLFAAVSDFDGDGRKDLIVTGNVPVADPAAAHGLAWFATGESDGSFEIANLPIEVGSYPTSIAVHDENGASLDITIGIASLRDHGVTILSSVIESGVPEQVVSKGSPIWVASPTSVGATADELLIFDLSEPTPLILPAEQLFEEVDDVIYDGRNIRFDGVLVLHDDPLALPALIPLIEAATDARVEGMIPELGMLRLAAALDVPGAPLASADLLELKEIIEGLGAPGTILVEADTAIQGKACDPGTEDPYLADQWYFETLRIPAAKLLAVTGSSATLAIIDGWLDVAQSVDGLPTTPMLFDVDGAVWSGAPDYELIEVPRARVGDAHPLIIAEILAAESCNAIGVEGLLESPSLVSIPVLDHDGFGLASRVAYALVLAADQGIDVANLSLGALGESEVLRRAVAYASQRGTVVVGAAGNRGNPYKCDLPAAAEGALCIAAIDPTGQPSAFTNGGASVAAPGEEIPNAGGLPQKGTSYSAAFASGLALMMRAAAPDLPVEALLGVIQQSAQPLAGDCDGPILDEPGPLCVVRAPAAPLAPRSASSATSGASSCLPDPVVGHGILDFQVAVERAIGCAAGSRSDCEVGLEPGSQQIVALDLIAAIVEAAGTELFIGESGFVSGLIDSLEF